MTSHPRFLYKFGTWVWDDTINGISFQCHDALRSEASTIHRGSIVPSVRSKLRNTDIHFKDDVGLLEKIKFRKKYQRRCQPDEPEIILLQDIKDVVFFTTDPKDLHMEIIDFLHIPIIDRLIRALIIYFQYYFQVWDKIMRRREEIKNRLTQPVVVEIEHIIRDNLSDLRSMASREYGAMAMGTEDGRRFHHMANKNGNSLSDRDRRIFQMMIKMVIRITWLALERPNISLIEIEVYRLISTDSFNGFVHQGKKTRQLETYSFEDKILQGSANVKEPRLLQRSPLGKEILIANHDHRMLAIGFVTFPPSDERLNFLEIAYSAPEELLSTYGITVGILGLKRTEFDEMLKRIVIKRKTDDDEEEEEEEYNEVEFEFTFIIPNVIKYCDSKIPGAFPNEPPRFPQSKERAEMIRKQCSMWKLVVENAYLKAVQSSLSGYSASPSMFSM